MPTYRLTPIDPNHRDWEASYHKGPCLVYAANELAAREAVTLEFVRMTKPKLGGDTIHCPWGNPERVTCIEIHDMSAEPPPEGIVLIPDGGGWRKAT